MSHSPVSLDVPIVVEPNAHVFRRTRLFSRSSDVPIILNWDRLDGGHEGFHLARHDRSVAGAPRHAHDFAEVFWLEAGEVTHVSPGGSHLVRAGDMVLVAPEDAHRFARPSHDLAMANLAIPLVELGRLRARYFPDGGFPWDGPSPRRFSSPPFRPDGLGITDRTVDRLTIDRFLIEVLVAAGGIRRPGMPLWLVDAIHRWRRDPAAMERGVAGLAEIASCSRGHVSRVVRRTTGATAIHLLNGLRMEVAAARLMTTDVPIARVAADVGIHSLGHFYRLFGERYGTTPGRHRAASRR